MKSEILITAIIFLFLTSTVAAQDLSMLGNYLIKLICFALMIIPWIVTILIMVGGILILTGDTVNRKRGKYIIINAVIGFIILLIVAWVVTLTTEAIDFSDFMECAAGGALPEYPATTTILGPMAPWADARVGLSPPPEGKVAYSAPNILVYFDGSRSIDFDGTIVEYNWDFGDGGTATGMAAEHNYTGYGEYEAWLKIKDDDDMEDMDSVKVILKELEAHILKPKDALCFPNVTGLEIEFQGEGRYGVPFNPPAEPYLYEWKSNISGVLSNSASFSMDVASLGSGSHRITFTVEDRFGNQANDTINIRIVPPLNATILSPAVGDDDVNCSEIFNGTVSGGLPPYYVEWKVDEQVFATGTINVDGGTHSPAGRPPASGIYNLTFEATDSCDLTASDERNNTNISVCRFDVLIAAIKSNLQSTYSAGQITQLENKIKDYQSALQNDGLSSIFLYLDEDETSDLIGSKVTSPGSWNNIDAVLNQLIPELDAHYLVIIGGYSRFSQAPIGSSEGSDDPYGDIDLDGNYMPDISVGRFPDPNGGDLAVILNALDTSINAHKAGGLSLSPYTAPIMSCGGIDNRPWNSGRCFCLAVWGGSCSACGSCCGCIGSSALSGKKFVMILAHGPGPSSSDLYSGGCLDVTPSFIHSLDVSRAVWMVMSCGGGHLRMKSSTSGSMTMTFLKHGGAVYFGSTDLNYGGMGGSCPVLGGDGCIGSLYAEVATRFAAGKRIGDAYREGKNYYFNRYSCGAGTSYQYHINCLYGDPTLKIKNM